MITFKYANMKEHFSVISSNLTTSLNHESNYEDDGTEWQITILKNVSKTLKPTRNTHK